MGIFNNLSPDTTTTTVTKPSFDLVLSEYALKDDLDGYYEKNKDLNLGGNKII